MISIFDIWRRIQMISHENIVNLMKNYNINDEKWTVNILDELMNIVQQKKSSCEPFRIKQFNIKKFSVPEYYGVDCTPDEKNCLIWGSHRSGKSTTYEALLYGLLDRKAIIRPSIGKPNISITLSNGSKQIKITREYRKNLLVEMGKETYEGTNAKSLIQEYTGIDPEDYRTFRALTLPQRSESDSILQLTNEKEFATIIERLGSDKRFSQLKTFVQIDLDEIEKKIKKLEIQDLDMAYNETIMRQRISSTRYTINQLDDYINNYKSNELEKIVATFEKKPETKIRLQKLEKDFQQLWREEVHLKKLVGKATHIYVDKTPEEVVENVLMKVVCPVCENNIDIEKFQNRIKNKKCPLCNEAYTWKILAKAELKIEESKKVEEWRLRIGEIEKRKTEIEEEKKKLGFEYSHETIRRVIKEQISENDYETVKKELRAANEILENDKKDLEKFSLIKIENKKEFDNLKNKNDFFIHLLSCLDDTELIKKVEDDFEKKINAIFKQITGSETNLEYKDGEIFLVEKYGQQERKRKARNKYEISFAEKRVLDISIVLSLFSINRKSRYYNIDFIILDDVTEGIMDEYWKKNLIEILRTIDTGVQLVCTSYDEQIKQLKFDSENKLQIQKKIDENW